MEDTPDKVVIANLVFTALWISAVAVILVAGQRWRRLRSFRDNMIAQWRPVRGYVYTRQGYETAVLTHTLSDWIPFILFAG